MKNSTFFKIFDFVLMVSLLASCLGMEDTAPCAMETPQIQSFSILRKGSLEYELTAAVAEEDLEKITGCGYYVSKYKNMQDAVRIESKMSGQKFTGKLSLSADGEKLYVCAYISVTLSHVEICSDMKDVIAGEDIGDNLSTSSSANCYIVSKAGSYKIPSVKGNSSESVGDVKSVEVLWESFGTSTTPKVGSLVKSMSYGNGTITFHTADTFREGNAVIAAKNASGTILWSWHIWFTDEPQEQVYYNNAGTMMDRNLGATSATPGDVGALGLLYQWGRKDPFLGSSSISNSVVAKSTITWPSVVKSSASYATIAYSIEHPTMFILPNHGFDWTSGDSRWQSNKTIYDPCPAGWRVPDGGYDGVWAKANIPGIFHRPYDSAKKGIDFSGTFGSASSIWYPVAGYRHDGAGDLAGVGNDSQYWSVTPNGSDSFDFRFYCWVDSYNAEAEVMPTFDTAHRAFGQSVRCFKE